MCSSYIAASGNSCSWASAMGSVILSVISNTYLKSEQRHIITLFTDKTTEVHREQTQLINDGAKTQTQSSDPKPIFLKFQANCPLISSLFWTFKTPTELALSTVRQDHIHWDPFYVQHVQSGLSAPQTLHSPIFRGQCIPLCPSCNAVEKEKLCDRGIKKKTLWSEVLSKRWLCHFQLWDL